MWTCRKCATQAEAAHRVCPSCGAVDPTTSMDDEATLAGTIPAFEPPTEYDVHDLPDPGVAVVECYIGVTDLEASVVAESLRDVGIPVFVDRDESGGGPVHRVRVPITDLGRALAVVDLLRKRRALRH